MELLTAAQMRAIEQAAINSGDVTGLELMERAGRGVVEAIFEWRPKLAASPGHAVVLCGPGNNGGDGFVVARLLRGQGWEVDVFLYGDEAKLPPDAAENCRRWREVGELEELREPPDADLYVDALFGGGLTRPLADDLRIVRPLLRPDIAERTMAVDGPSGLCLDSGKTLGFAFPAGATCTFQRERHGHYLNDGPEMSGRLFVKDIGLENWFCELSLPEALDAAPALRITATVKQIDKSATGHKFSHGHALVLSGGVGKGGAARMTARGALRIGAGLVTVGAPPSALIENASQLNAIMLARIEGAEGLSEVLQDGRVNSVIIGPGLGVSERTRDMTLAALQSRQRSVVLDADALTVFQDDPAKLFDATRGKNVVLAPHMGEFRRLFPDIAEAFLSPSLKGPAYSKVDAARDAASRAGCVVLLKGPDTVVADPNGGVSVISAAYDRACPWLATAGSGDVLAGFIGGLLARGFNVKSAAETGAWLHQECAREFGPGLIAEDLPETLPKVFRNLGL